MRKGMVFCVILLVGAAVLMFGCATMKKDATAPATIGDLNRMSAAWGKQLQETSAKLEAKIDGFAAKVEKKPVVEAAPLAPKEEKATLLLVKPEAAAPATSAAPPMTEAIADLQKRVGVLEIKTNTLGNAFADTSRDVGLLKKKVAGIKIRLVKVNKTVGATLELTGKSGERYFLLGPFAVGSAEVKGPVASELKALATLMEKEKLVAAKIIGFADTTPFKSAKDSAENKTKNLELAKSRANAVAKALGKLTPEYVEILARGTTEQFNGRAANRCVMVVVKKVAAPAASVAPVPSAPSAPSAPAKPEPSAKK